MRGINKRDFTLVVVSITIILLLVGWIHTLFNTKYSADGGYSTLTPKSADDFVKSIGTTTHLHYDDYKSNQHFSDLFNQLINPKIQSLGISYIRQFPVELDGNFTDFVNKYNLISRGGPKLVNFNWETSPVDLSSSSPQNICYLPKLKYLKSSTLSNCDGLASHNEPSNVATKSIENPNEPDHCASYICGVSTVDTWFSKSLSQNPNWPDDVLSTAQTAYNKIKSDPSTQGVDILAPSLVWLPYYGNETYNGVNLKTYMAPLKNYATLGNVHPYCHLRSIATCFDSLVQPYVDYYSPKPVIVTETGFSTTNYSEQVQAKKLLRILFDFFDRGISQTYVYELLDEPSAPTAEENNFGLLNEDGREKPAFTWIKNAIALLNTDSTINLTPLAANIESLPTLRTTLLQTSDSSYWLAMQNDIPGSTSSDTNITSTISFPDLKNIAIYNLETTSPYKTVNNVSSLAVDVPDRIVLVKITDPEVSPGSTSSGSGSTNSQSSNQVEEKENSTTNSNSFVLPKKDNETPAKDSGFTLLENISNFTSELPVWVIAFSIIGLVLGLTTTIVLILRKQSKNR